MWTPREIARIRVFSAVLALLLLGCALTAHADRRGRKYKGPPTTASIQVTVVRSTNGKPISGAAVIFHPIKNDKDQGALELKSDPDGVVKIDVIPIGDTVRLQVVADGWRTYGEDYKIDAASKEILVKLKRPSSQYSIDGKQTAPPSETAPKGGSTSAKPNSQTPLPQ